MINRLRPILKSLLSGLPGIGSYFRARFDRSEARYLRKQAVAEKQRLRRMAKDWRQRIRDVMECPDNQDIVRVPGAGQRHGNDILMHNGLRVAYGTYGTEDTIHTMRMLEENGGVHEPQEEKIFQQVLPLMPPGAVMLELGAFWGFYSLWFASVVKEARCFLVEPVWANLNAGRLNFALNHLTATFINGFGGGKYRRQPFQAPVLSVDWLMQEHGLEKIHLLHSDIQGYEREMLDGAEKAVNEGRVDWIFISTHSPNIHDDCRAWLMQRKWSLVADADLPESYSVDGLLVAHRPGMHVPPFNSLARKPRGKIEDGALPLPGSGNKCALPSTIPVSQNRAAS